MLNIPICFLWVSHPQNQKIYSTTKHLIVVVIVVAKKSSYFILVRYESKHYVIMEKTLQGVRSTHVLTTECRIETAH